MRFEHTPFPESEILDARPGGDGWVVLRWDGSFDLDGLEGTLELHVSADGVFATVVKRFGRRGRVFRGGERTMDLDRGDYHPETSVFPCAFFVREGRTLLVHGTDWNRLDVSDPATGECLTARGPTVCTDADAVPPHYLDRFHAGLAVSPDGRWVAEDGWHWHPLGVLRVWSLADWLDQNVWESEDGPSIREVTRRVYFWDTPTVWLDEDRLAFWGAGDDADEMRPAVRVYDAALGEEVAAFDGPQVAPAQSWGPNAVRTGWLAFDGRLFAVSPERGTEVWTLAGERLHHEAGFAPRRYHPGRKEFLSWGGGGAFASRLVP